jgi:hypothetical protein
MFKYYTCIYVTKMHIADRIQKYGKKKKMLSQKL